VLSATLAERDGPSRAQTAHLLAVAGMTPPDQVLPQPSPERTARRSDVLKIPQNVRTELS